MSNPLTGNSGDKSSGGGITDTVTDSAKGVTSTVGNLAGGVSETVGGVAGSAGKGLGDTVGNTTGQEQLGKPLSGVGQGLEDGGKGVGGGVKDAGNFGGK